MRNRQLLIKMNKEVVRVLSDLRFYKELNMIGISLCIFFKQAVYKQVFSISNGHCKHGKRFPGKDSTTLLKAETNCKNSSTQRIIQITAIARGSDLSIRTRSLHSVRGPTHKRSENDGNVLYLLQDFRVSTKEGQYFDSRRYCLGLFKKMGRAKTKGKEKKEKIPNDNLFIATRNYCIPLGLSGLEQTASSLSFSLALVRGVHTRASVERRSREFRETWAAAREEKRVSLFSYLSCLAPSVNLRGHLRVSRVLLDGSRKKRDCSQSRSRTVS